MSDDFRKRYMTEPLLCSMVDMQLEALLHGDLTPQDLARSAVLAATLYAERYQVPCVVVIGDPGLPDWKPALGDIVRVVEESELRPHLHRARLHSVGRVTELDLDPNATVFVETRLGASGWAKRVVPAGMKRSE